MNKKRLQRLGVVCMAAAMVLTTVSFPRAAKAEEGTLTQADASTSTEQEAGKVLMQVKPSVLQGNAISNSQQDPAQGNDGLASWAFDEEAHWWHSRWSREQKVHLKIRSVRQCVHGSVRDLARKSC